MIHCEFPTTKSPCSPKSQNSNYSPSKMTPPRTAGFNSKRDFKAALKNASYNLNEDDFDIHSGLNPEPRFVLGIHPRSKRLIFRDMNFEIYNPKIGYMKTDGRRIRLFSQHQIEPTRSSQPKELSPNSKLFDHMLERTPIDNLRFPERIALEQERENEDEGKVQDIQDKSISLSPSRPEKTYESVKYKLLLKQTSKHENNLTNVKYSEVLSTSVIEKKASKQIDRNLKLDPLNDKWTVGRKQSTKPFENSFIRLHNRKYSQELGAEDKKKILNVSKIAFHEGKSLKGEHPKTTLPTQGKFNNKNKKSKRNFRIFRQVLSRTLFKKLCDGNKTSDIVQRLYFGSMLTKRLSE